MRVAVIDMNEEIRSSREVAERAVVLYCVVKSADVEDRVIIRDWLKREKLWSAVSRAERKLFGKGKLSNRQLVNASWRVEALEAIVWALGLLPSLTSNTVQCSYRRIEALFPFYLESAELFLKQSKLRSEDDIERALEEIYNQHWKVRDARLNQKEAPDKLDEGIIREKHYALNWIMSYEGQDWDNVSTDT